ncbi:hypothetical protein BRC78_02595 [Halobacteriales archaeon QH_8_68_33]|nr:MAG: hypothetical protein BRC78_02595 [Halobacteriales archaeon QH_8_68_33]
MTGPRSSSRNGPTLRALLAAVRDDLAAVVAAIAAFLGAAIVTWGWLRVAAWDALKSDVAALSTDLVVAVTPWDVILFQATVALAVGAVFALEAACYRARAVLLGGRWPRFPLPATARSLLVVAGVILFPLGALVGYEQVFPAVVAVLDTGGRWTVVEWGRAAAAVALASGVAAQGALVAVVLAYGRGGRPDAAPEADTH